MNTEFLYIAHRPAETERLAEQVRSLRAQSSVRRDEIDRLRRRMSNLERVIARYIPVEREVDPVVGPQDRLAIISARAQYAKRQGRRR